MDERVRGYGKVYNMGHHAIKELFLEPVLVEEKVDGSQFSFGVIGGEVRCRSNGAQLHMDGPVEMFTLAVETAKELRPLLVPGWTYRGEFLRKPRHNTIAYDRVPKKNVILFDVDTGNQAYLPRSEKEKIAAELGLEIVPVLFEGMVTSLDQFNELLDTDSILGGSKIEGMVFKNYARFGPDGKCMMGKYVSEAFKERHTKEWKKANPGHNDVVQDIIKEHATEARWKKALQHLSERGELHGDPTDIGPCMKEIHIDLKEECADEIKAAIFKWAWPKIARGVAGGFPAWYKEQLAGQQFAKEAEEIARRGYGEEIEGVDSSHYGYGPIKVLHEDKKR